MKALIFILTLLSASLSEKTIQENINITSDVINNPSCIKTSDLQNQSLNAFSFRENLYSNETDSLNLAVNPELKLVNGNVSGWQLIKTNESLAELTVDHNNKDVLIIKNLYYDRFTQKTSLPAGHYLFRALVKTNVFQIYAYSSVNSITDRYSFRIPIMGSNEFTWVELPFYITAPEGYHNLDVEFGFQYNYLLGGTGTAARFSADLYIKKIELIRLGDTSIPHAWEKNIPAHLQHGLETLNSNNPDWDQPDRVIFKDSFLGTEIWLMTQGGQTDMSYVGFPDFSNNGKYIQAGFRRPGYVLRTDGTYRYYPTDESADERWSNKLLWPFPWEEKRIPAGTDKSDWIVTSRDNTSINMLNLSTGKTHQIIMPSRPGWHIIHYPSQTVHAIRGPAIGSITYETLVWQSEDKKSIALSDMEGNNFRSFVIKSISSRPENDVVHPTDAKDSPIIGLVGGKGGDNWRNAVDRDGNRYFIFEINREKSSDDPYNPYQLWAISLTNINSAKLLRIVPYPGVNKIYNDQREYNLKWWEFAAGFPQSGDNGIFMLEDGTHLNMSSLGVHSGFPTTISSLDFYTNKSWFIASYPKNTWSADRISWPHEFKRDRDFAVLEAITDAAPFGPLVMIDLKHKSVWTLVYTNYYDYMLRYWQRPQYRDRPGYIEYNKPMFRHCPTPSPDFTKVTYCSSMLTGNDPEKMWGDAYIAIARYPQPPVNVRLDGNTLVWDRPFYCKEIKGFNVYYSEQSGKGSYKKLNKEPIENTKYDLLSNNTTENGFYVVTSVEHSGLESRNFSNEVSVGKNKIFRHFYQAEEGELINPMVPFFEPSGAANSYAVAITDPELLYKKNLGEGMKGSVGITVSIPQKGKCKIWARVRGMSARERSTYTTGWASPSEKYATGSFDVIINGKTAGQINVDRYAWKWMELNAGTIKFTDGKNLLEFATNISGIAIDNILITNDILFHPDNPDNTPVNKPSAPSSMRTEIVQSTGKDDIYNWRGYNIKGTYVKLTWNPSTAPQGVRYYNIYRNNTENFSPAPATLIGSTIEPIFIDTKIKNSMEYYYKIVAVDNWDNSSEASTILKAVIP